MAESAAFADARRGALLSASTCVTGAPSTRARGSNGCVPCASMITMSRASVRTIKFVSRKRGRSVCASSMPPRRRAWGRRASRMRSSASLRTFHALSDDDASVAGDTSVSISTRGSASSRGAAGTASAGSSSGTGAAARADLVGGGGGGAVCTCVSIVERSCGVMSGRRDTTDGPANLASVTTTAVALVRTAGFADARHVPRNVTSAGTSRPTAPKARMA